MKTFTASEGGKIIPHVENKGRLTGLISTCEKLAIEGKSVGNWRTGKKR